MSDLVLLYRHRELLWVWTGREIRVKYKQSVLGIAWAILQPLALLIAFTVVFSLILRVPTGETPYPVFSYTAVLPWTFFASSISLSIPSLVNNMNLVTKVSFPREILPLATILAGVPDLLVASILFVGLLAYYSVPLHWTALWVIPLLVIQLVLTIAVTLLGSALIVLYRDIRFLIPLLTQIWMYATPVIYPVDLIPERWQPLYYLNPMAGLIEGYRTAILAGKNPMGVGVILAAGISLIGLVVAHRVFKRLEPSFADLI